MEITIKTDTATNLITTYILPLLAVVLPLLGAAMAWVINEWRKRVWEDYQRKEANYRELLKALRGFYAAAENDAMKKTFLEQINLCWLYCPDDVIRKVYDFLDKVARGDEGKEVAAGEFVLAIRKDLLSINPFWETTLKPEEFRILITSEEQMGRGTRI
jgi:hypothetical protein